MAKQSTQLEIDLSRKKQLLTPFAVPDHKSQQATPFQIAFDIIVGGDKPEQLSVEIIGHGVIFSTQLDARYCEPGSHQWQWDGFDNHGKLSTKALKASALTVTLVATTQGFRAKAKTSLHFRHARQDWVDIVIDRNSATAKVDVTTHISDGGDHGVNEAPPEKVLQNKSISSLPASDPRRKKHTRLQSFPALKQMLASGFKRYWSRSISVNGKAYAVDSQLIFSREHAMADIAITYNTNRSWIRSSNPGSVRGIVSLFGNLIPKRISYNVGWIKYGKNWYFELERDANLDFQHTGAHELGHEILSAYGGEKYSYGHRGSSTVVTQQTKKVANGGESFPHKGEIDLMKYYNGVQPPGYFNRSSASEQDVLSLFWLAALEAKRD